MVDYKDTVEGIIFSLGLIIEEEHLYTFSDIAIARALKYLLQRSK